MVLFGRISIAERFLYLDAAALQQHELVAATIVTLLSNVDLSRRIDLFFVAGRGEHHTNVIGWNVLELLAADGTEK